MYHFQVPYEYEHKCRSRSLPSRHRPHTEQTLLLRQEIPADGVAQDWQQRERNQFDRSLAELRRPLQKQEYVSEGDKLSALGRRGRLCVQKYHTKYHLANKFGFEKVAITLRSSISANDDDWAAMLYDGEKCYFSRSYHLHIVDRVGGGDSFGAGLIYALISAKDTQSAVEFAVAASALKHSVEGDFNRISVSEVEKLACGDDSGRVQR